MYSSTPLSQPLHPRTLTMRFVSTVAVAAVALTSSTVSSFVSPSSSIIKASTTTNLKMSEVEQPDVSAYMSGARPVSAKEFICIYSL